MNETPMLTTKDNPFNPFEDFSHWLLYDKEFGYDCADILARLARTSDSLSEEENLLEIDRAIDEIILNDDAGFFLKVTPSTFDEVMKQRENF